MIDALLGQLIEVKSQMIAVSIINFDILKQVQLSQTSDAQSQEKTCFYKKAVKPSQSMPKRKSKVVVGQDQQLKAY